MEVRAPLRPSGKSYTVDIVPSKSGEPVPVVNGKSLHSRYDPSGEASRWAAEKLSKKSSVKAVVVMGMGFAYHIEALRRSLPPDVPIVVFEPIPEIVSAYVGSVRRNIDNVRLWPNPSPQEVVDAVVEVLNPTLLNQVLIVGHPPSVELDPASYQSILNQINSTVDLFAMSLTTGWGFGFEWIDNALKNVHRLPDLPFVQNIISHLGTPAPAALVLGAGPSLDDAWDAVRDSHVLKLAVDTALEPMQSRGLSPHLSFLFDSQVENTRLVDRVHAPDVNLVVSLEVQPKVFDRNWRNLILASCDQGLLTWLELRGNFRAGYLKQGGSVVTCAFDLARQAGCSPIYLGGVDLSFSGHRVYCRGTAYERQAVESQSRFASAEQAMIQMRQERTERTVAGRATQDNMYNYYRWLKDEIGRTAQPVVMLKKAGLLSDFLPSDGADRLRAETYPAGFDERRFESRLDPNGVVTRDFLKESLVDFRRLLESFLSPSNFADADRLETSLAESGIADVIETVVEPAIAVSRYEREKGEPGKPLFDELRDRLAGLLKSI